MKNIKIKVKGSKFEMDQSLYDYINEIEIKEIKTLEEELAVEKFRSLRDLYQEYIRPVQHAKKAFSISTPEVQLEVVLQADPPSHRNLIGFRRDGKVIKGQFSIPVIVEGAQEREVVPFVNWYINSFSCLIRYLLCKQAGVRVIQPLEDRKNWNLEAGKLNLDLDFVVVFE